MKPASAMAFSARSAMWKIVQTDAKKSRLRTTSNQLYNGKGGSVTLHMWDDDDKFGMGPHVCFSVLT